jgi:hypothetical protein
MKTVSLWQSLLTVLGVLLVIGGFYGYQWNKSELQVVNAPLSVLTARNGFQERTEQAPLKVAQQPLFAQSQR